MSMRAHDAQHDAFGASESASVIDRHSEFDGTYSTDRDLRIEGRAKGKIPAGDTTANALYSSAAVAIKGEAPLATLEPKAAASPTGSSN